MIQSIASIADGSSAPPSATIATRAAGDARVSARFADALAAQGDDGETREQTVRAQARKLVATTFISPLLARMREDPFRSDLFHGGFAEDTFGAQLDTIFADRIVDQMDTRAAAQPGDAGGAALVDLVYQRIMSHTAPAKSARHDEPARAYAGGASDA